MTRDAHPQLRNLNTSDTSDPTVFSRMGLGSQTFASLFRHEPPNARHHPRPHSMYMRGFVKGRRVHAVVRLRLATIQLCAMRDRTHL
jgi:hypothetical protein